MAKKEVGWIKLYRSITDSWLWEDKPFAYGQAWIDLLLLANYEDKKIQYKGEIVTCKRGTVNLSMSFLADRWGWNRKRVARFLKLLESDKMCLTNSTTHRTTITLINYEDFQKRGTTNGTTDGTTSVQQVSITKNNKNIKNINNIANYQKKTNKFNQFPQNTYDFEELEKRLYRN